MISIILLKGSWGWDLAKAATSSAGSAAAEIVKLPVRRGASLASSQLAS